MLCAQVEQTCTATKLQTKILHFRSVTLITMVHPIMQERLKKIKETLKIRAENSFSLESVL